MLSLLELSSQSMSCSLHVQKEESSNAMSTTGSNHTLLWQPSVDQLSGVYCHAREFLRPLLPDSSSTQETTAGYVALVHFMLQEKEESNSAKKHSECCLWL